MVVGAICLLAVTEYCACTFFANPLATRLYLEARGRLPQYERDNCRDIDSQTIAALTTVLTTLLALSVPTNHPPEV